MPYGKDYSDEILAPIHGQLKKWIDYRKNEPQDTEPQDIKDDYRLHNDTDCLLMEGSREDKLKADMIISLWHPLRFTLVNLNDNFRGKIMEVAKCEVSKEDVRFLEFLDSNLENYLPASHDVVKSLSKLFVLGNERENVMKLPCRALNKIRGKAYYDYMPHFLSDCLDESGRLSSYFVNVNVKTWIREQHLTPFFENEEIKKSSIKDLSGSGDITNNKPPNVDKLNSMINGYIAILEKRKDEMKI